MSGRNFFPALAALLVAGCAQGGAVPTPPVITAQGFDIAEPREALPGAMGDVRLRFEVPDKIDAIWITEGTFRADLAKTLDRDLFRQFGLAQRPYSQSDVTINFRNYVNEKLTDVGAYRIDIEVTDHRGRSASVQVLINIQGANDSATASAAEVLGTVVATGDFALRRIGPGGVSGAEPFGITWRTIDPIKVTIRIKASSDGATKIARLRHALNSLRSWTGAFRLMQSISIRLMRRPLVRSWRSGTRINTSFSKRLRARRSSPMPVQRWL